MRQYFCSAASAPWYLTEAGWVHIMHSSTETGCPVGCYKEVLRWRVPTALQFLLSEPLIMISVSDHELPLLSLACTHHQSKINYITPGGLLTMTTSHASHAPMLWPNTA
jgi:hypothetical protein